MISCHIIHLEQRCRERGYTLEQATPCIVSRNGDRITVDELHPAYPRAAPGIVAKARSFTRSVVRHAAAGLPQATDEQREARWAICQQCPHLEAGKCRLCGCPIVRDRRLISKLSMARESCPAGKWGAVAN